MIRLFHINKRIIYLFLIVQLGVSPVFSFRSEFIEVDNHYEDVLLNEFDSVSDIEAGLIASGIDPELFTLYGSEIIRWKSEIEDSLPKNATQRQIAVAIGEYLHTHVFVRYQLSATTLKEVFEQGLFNCLSATVLMNMILRMFNIEAKAIILPTHVYTLAVLDGKMSEIENTIKDGLSISENKEAQAQFNKLTGFDYNNDSKKKVVISWKENIGLLYSNRSYFYAKKNNHNAAFQQMLKAQVFLAESPSEQTNLSVGYLNYSYNIYKNPNQSLPTYLKTLSILEEGLTRYPYFSNLKGNYLKGVGLVIDKMIKSDASNKDIDTLLESSREYIDSANFIKLEKMRYINGTIYAIRSSTNFEQASQNINIMLQKYPNDKSTKDLVQEYSYSKAKKKLQTVTKPEQDESLITELENFPKELVQDSLGYYYSEIAKRYFDEQLFQQAVNIMLEAKTKFSNVSLIKQNGFVYAVNAAQHYLNIDDLDNALLFYKEALKFKKDRQVIYNMGILYEKLAHKYASTKNIAKTKQLLEEGIALVPNNDRLKMLASQYNL